MSNAEYKLDKVDKLVRDALKKSVQPISTYDIAKKLKVSWSTANIHCYKLKAYGYIDSKEDEVKIGVKRVVWWLRGKA